MRLARIRGHYIYPAALNQKSVVIDAGAHRGEFSALITARFHCLCHLVEANPFLARELPQAGTASITTAALGPNDGRAAFYLHQNPESGSLVPAEKTGASPAIEVEEISLPALMRRLSLDHIDLLKLDVEGAEFDLIAATPESVLRRVSQITVEFHDFQSRFSGQNLFVKARARLQSLGFICGLMSFRTHGDVLFLNQRLLRLSRLQSVYVSYFARVTEKTKSLCSA